MGISWSIRVDASQVQCRGLGSSWIVCKEKLFPAPFDVNWIITCSHEEMESRPRFPFARLEWFYRLERLATYLSHAKCCLQQTFLTFQASVHFCQVHSINFKDHNYATCISFLLVSTKCFAQTKCCRWDGMLAGTWVRNRKNALLNRQPSGLDYTCSEEVHYKPHHLTKSVGDCFGQIASDPSSRWWLK